MSFDSTMKFTTNMTRAEIDAKLPELRTFSTAAQLDDITKLLSDTVALPATELAERMVRCQQITGGKDDYALLYDQLDMLIINLRNL